MEWREEGVVLAVRRHGESAAILEVLTASRGRHAGLVRGGAGRKLAPVLQPGAMLELNWRARLEEHLGSFTVEPLRARSGLMADRAALAGLTSLTALASFGLAERQPCPDLYATTLALLDRMELVEDWPAYYVGWELELLAMLGFGLDLEVCALSGAQENLAYVSPRTGRAVSAEAGAEWAGRLLPLPPFLRRDAGEAPITVSDIVDGLRLTGHFLTRWLCPALGREALPPARGRLVQVLSRP